MNLSHHRSQLAIFLIALCAFPACAEQQNGTYVSADCPAPADVGSAHLHGRWQADVTGQSGPTHLRLGPHPEWQGTVRGTVERPSGTALMVGDVDAGALTLEESTDGQRISATWLGSATPCGCGQQFTGTWASADAPGHEHPFTLRRIPGKP